MVGKTFRIDGPRKNSTSLALTYSLSTEVSSFLFLRRPVLLQGGTSFPRGVGGPGVGCLGEDPRRVLLLPEL